MRRVFTAIALAAILAVLGVTRRTRRHGPVRRRVPNAASHVLAGVHQPAGGLDLDVYFSSAPRTDTPVIVWTATSIDSGRRTSMLIPVPVGSISLYSYAGVQQQPGTTSAFVNLEYSPGGVGSGMCVSDIEPAAGQAVELRPCNTKAGAYNPFQAYSEITTDAGDGTFVAFEDAPVTGTEATGLYLTDLRPASGIGKAGHRVAVVSAAQDGALSEGQFWAAAA